MCFVLLKILLYLKLEELPFTSKSPKRTAIFGLRKGNPLGFPPKTQLLRKPLDFKLQLDSKSSSITRTELQ